MLHSNKTGAALLGVFVFLGLVGLGYLLANAAVKVKQFERTVTVKGLSERDFPADVVIWPIQFSAASNDLQSLYVTLEDNTAKVRGFLTERGVEPGEISASPPTLTDKSAQEYGNASRAEFRYTARQTVTVYSQNVERVRGIVAALSDLGKQGIALTGGEYQAETEYLFTGLNAAKPGMIEEATRNAREVAEKFAADSKSTLGKIKNATQGQFTIEPRDKNNPHIKKVRVVSTVEYYLSD